MSTMVFKGNPHAITTLKFGRDTIRKAFTHHLIVENMRMGRFTYETNQNVYKLTDWITSILGPPQNWYDEDVPAHQTWADAGHGGYAFRSEVVRSLITDRIVVINESIYPMSIHPKDSAQRESTIAEVAAWVAQRDADGQKITWINHLLLIDDSKLVIDAIMRWR